jgi:SAM-dependent methyltransferase
MGASIQLPDARTAVDLQETSSRVDDGTGVAGSQKRWTQFWYVAHRLDALVADLVSEAEIRPGDTVVDYGCGEQPYRSLFEGCQYIAVDLPGNSGASVHIDSSGRVPLPNASADLVISTQVLVHVSDPKTYLHECHRILRPGGTLVLTTHGIMFLHPHPTDYWRWTCDGLRLVVERAGFELVGQRGLLTLTAAGLQLIQHHYLTKVRSAIGMRLIGAFFQALIAYADRHGTDDERRENGLVLGVRAIKPVSPG